MKKLRKKIYAAAGYNTTYFGSGRKEFHPKKPMPSFEEYLKETAQGTLSQVPNPIFDEGVISNFMSARFLKQGNLAGFLPFMVPDLEGKACTRVEGACGSGGLGIMSAVKSILSDMADSVFVTGFEVQNTMKAVYVADVLAGAGYINGHRKNGHAYYFPGIFSDRAGAYAERYDKKLFYDGMAKWFEVAIENARKNPKAQEFHNSVEDLFTLGCTPPNGKRFVDHLNLFHCSKVTDGASSLVIASEEGLEKLGIPKEQAVELVGISCAEGNITQTPADLTEMSTSKISAQKTFEMANVTKDDIGLYEIHDCFAVTGLLAMEAIGISEAGKAAENILNGEISIDGKTPINASGGLGGFGHPVGATGVRQLVDLIHQFTGKADNPVQNDKDFGFLLNMGGNDISVTSLIVKRT
ncbi:MAG: 3-ketoacyl-CoA thiolase [Cytophagales bacterium]|nr:3-ketoacyl-CoA thiolase [Cytophagales bacterium]